MCDALGNPLRFIVTGGERHDCTHTERNLVERKFGYLKHFRRVATRYDKTALSFLSFVQLAASYLWL